MKQMQDGSILTPAGFRAGAARSGIKSAAGEPDVALIVPNGPAAAAGVFTKNCFASPTVSWNRANLPADDLRAVVVNAGIANAATGPQGERDVGTTAALVADLIGAGPRQVCVASTGKIGRRLPMGKLEAGVREAHAQLSAEPAAARLAERAIMTTDTRPKSAAVRATAGGESFHVGGMAKGSGMIAPNMATMLAFLTTDVTIAPALLQTVLREAAERTFNRITVDGDTSTNDTLLALASGCSDAVVTEGAASEAFAEALTAVARNLALQVVKDGEGATTLVRVRVAGAADAAGAELVARAIAESQLVKCAVAGGDPNWGRIVCAAGYSGARVSPETTTVRIGDVCVFQNGQPTEADAAGQMRGQEVSIAVELGLGTGKATVWGCDLTEEYVVINAKYGG